MYIENIVLVGIIVIAWFAAKAHYADSEQSLFMYRLENALTYTLPELREKEDQLRALYQKNTGINSLRESNRTLKKDPAGQGLIDLLVAIKLLELIREAGWIKAGRTKPTLDYYPKISPKREIERQSRGSSSEILSKPMQASMGYWGRDAEWCIYLKQMRRGEVE